MNPKLLELATRHGALKARIAEQRRQLARHAEFRSRLPWYG
jgi:hypothetical protein